jgi:uncharacterized protein YkwD
MRRPVRLLPLALCVVVLLALAATASADSAATARRATPLEAALIREVNAARSARGLPTLVRSAGLSRAADVHTTAMFDVGRFDHQIPGFPTLAQRLRRFYVGGAQVWGGAENLALYGPMAPKAREIVQLWLDSPSHRDNLLDRSWRELGVSARFDAAPGGEFDGQPTWLITLDLGQRS